MLTTHRWWVRRMRACREATTTCRARAVAHSVCILRYAEHRSSPNQYQIAAGDQSRDIMRSDSRQSTFRSNR